MLKKEILDEIFEIDGVYDRLHNLNAVGITKELLLNTLSKTTYTFKEEFPCSISTTSKYLSIIFPDKPRTSAKVDNWILLKYGYKQCKHCLDVKYVEDFHKHSKHTDGLNTYCKDCQSILTAKTSADRQSRYRAAKLDRSPKWVSSSERSSILKFYLECPDGYQVDHIIPLQGATVSGLHVLSNLQYLTIAENCSKSNKYNAEFA